MSLKLSYPVCPQWERSGLALKRLGVAGLRNIHEGLTCSEKRGGAQNVRPWQRSWANGCKVVPNGFPSNHRVIDNGALIQRCQPARPVQGVRTRTGRKQAGRKVERQRASVRCSPQVCAALLHPRPCLSLLSDSGAKVVTHSDLSPKGMNWILLSLKKMLSRLPRQVVLIHGEQILVAAGQPWSFTSFKSGKLECSKHSQCVTLW